MNTSVRRFKGNMSLRDEDHGGSEALDAFWADCPKLAAIQNPNLANWYLQLWHDYLASEWAVTTTETGGGSATEVITDELGGALLVTNDDGDDESNEFQKVGECFQIVAGKPFWLEGKFRVNDATQSDFLFGLCITDTTLIDGMSDGVFFQKDDADANIDYHCIKDSGETGSNGDTGQDMADATYLRYGIKSVTAGVIEYWLGGLKRMQATANIPDDELLRISFVLQNGEAAAKTLGSLYIEGFQIR